MYWISYAGVSFLSQQKKPSEIDVWTVCSDSYGGRSSGVVHFDLKPIWSDKNVVEETPPKALVHKEKKHFSPGETFWYAKYMAGRAVTKKHDSSLGY